MDTMSNQACKDLLNLMKRFKAGLADIAETHGLTPIQLHALRGIAEGSITMSGLASYMHCDASNVTGMVDRLVAQNLVTRQEHEHDRRTKMLVLTEKGKKIVQDVFEQLPVQLGCEKLSMTECSVLHAVALKLAE